MISKHYLVRSSLFSLVLLIFIVAFQNCTGFNPADLLGAKSLGSNRVKAKDIVSTPQPVSVLMNGQGLCNSDNFAQVPGTSNTFLGRRMLTSNADPCSGYSWTISVFNFDTSSNTMNWVRDLFSMPIAAPDGTYTVTVGYDPTIIQYNGELFVAFECAGSGANLSIMVSGCVVPFTVAGGADTSRISIPVRGSQTGNEQYSTSVPKLLNFKNNIYMYWTAVHQDAQGNWKDLTTRGIQLTQESGGQRRLWAMGSVGTPAPAMGDSSVEVYGLNSSDATQSTTADTFQVLPIGDQLYITAGLGGSGCLNPLTPVFGCYHVQMSMASDPLGYHAFNQHPLNNSRLPYNPQEYSHIYQRDDGSYFMMGTYLPASLQGQSAPSTVFSYAGYQRYDIDLASFTFAGMPSGMLPIHGGDSITLGEGFTLGVEQSVQINAGLLIQQGDGNLVLYGNDWRPLWNSGASASCAGGCFTVFQGDGNLVTYAGNSPIFSTGTDGRGSQLVLSSQAPYLKILGSDGQPVWASGVGYVQQTVFVEALYQGLLGRAADAGGLQSWLSSAQSGGTSCTQLANGFLNSSEFAQRNLNNFDFVVSLYRGLLHREPDGGGLASWTSALDSQAMSRSQVISGFLSSVEFNSDCAAVYGFPSGAN